jgi:hypothetical protein
MAAVSEVAAVQDGLITAAQLAETGVDSSSVGRRVGLAGPWRRVLPGVYLVSGTQLDDRQRITAALLYARAPSVITGLAALDLGGVGSAKAQRGGAVHLLVPDARRRSSRGFVVVERSLHWPTVRRQDGWPVVPPARAAIDACRRIGRRDDVAALLGELVQTGRCTSAELASELAIAQRRGTALARAVLEGLIDGAASAPELRLRESWLASSLPAPLWNPDLFTSSGEFIARPDAYLDQSGVAVEVDSRAHHFGADQWDRTMRRHARMSAKGIVVLHVTPFRIGEDWGGIERDVRGCIDTQADRDLSGITVRPVRST